MRKKIEAPINKIHDLHLESIDSIIISLQSLVADEKVDKAKMKQLSDDLQELLRVYLKLNEFYTRLLLSNEDLD